MMVVDRTSGLRIVRTHPGFETRLSANRTLASENAASLLKRDLSSALLLVTQAKRESRSPSPLNLHDAS